MTMLARPATPGTYGELFTSFSRTDAPAADQLERDEKGRIARTFRTLELGAKEQDGKRLVVTKKMLEEMAANFEWRQSRGYKTPVVIGHPGVGEPTPAKAWEKRIEAPAIGWATGVEVRDDGLWVTVTFNQKFSEQLLDGGYEFNSPSFSDKWVDEFGNQRGAVLIDVGILNYPLQEGLGSIMAASALAGGTTMDPELKNMLDSILSRLEALEKGGSGNEEMGNRLSALENAMKEHSDAMSGAGEGDEKAKAAFAAKQKEIDNLSAKVNDAIVKLSEQVEESTKRTKELTDQAHAADCLQFLSQQVDLGNLAPSKLPDDWKEKPAKAFESMPFKSLAAAREHYADLKNTVVDLSSQAGCTGATGDRSASSGVSDEVWNMSSMRQDLIDKFDGDETKARRHYESLAACMSTSNDSDED